MIESITQFLGIMGEGFVYPETMAQMIPYLLQVFVSFGLLSAVFGLFRSIIMGLTTRRTRL